MKDWQQIFDSYRDSSPSLHGHPLQHLSKEITCPLLLQLPPLHLAPQPPLKWKHFVFHQDRCYFKFILSIYHLSCSHPDSNPVTFYLSCRSGFHPTFCYLSCHPGFNPAFCYLSCHCKCQLTDHSTAN